MLKAYLYFYNAVKDEYIPPLENLQKSMDYSRETGYILLEYMHMMKKMLNPGGAIIMSGLLVEDAEIIKEAAASAGFSNPHISTHSGWIAIHFG